MNQDWSDFQAFKGPAALSKAIFKVEKPEELREAAIDWFKILRDNVYSGEKGAEECGIPAERIQDVKTLLQTFFFDGTNMLHPIPILLAAEGHTQLKSIDVTFGAATLPIVDGPTALGYVFSIATHAGLPKSSAKTRTWDTFGVPLLTIFARFAAMTYCGRSIGWTDVKWQHDLPYMASMMYFHENNNFYYFLGSGFSTHTHYIRKDDADRLQSKMNSSRRGEILERGRDTTSGILTLGSLEPVLCAQAALVLAKVLVGIDVATDGHTLYNQDENGEIQPRKAYDYEYAVNNDVNDRVADQKKWGAAKRIVEKKHPEEIKKLREVFRRRWEQDLDKPLLPAARELFDMLYKAKSNNTAAERNEQWSAQCNEFLQVINHVFWWVSRQDTSLGAAGPSVKRFSRCAETYPIVALMSHWTPERSETSEVRGFAVSIRSLVQTVTKTQMKKEIVELAETFSLDSLNNLHEACGKGNVFWRSPCDNCKELLPKFGIKVGKDDYDKEFENNLSRAGLKRGEEED